MRGLRHGGMGRAKCNSGISDWTCSSRGGIFQDFLKPEHSLELDLHFITRSPPYIPGYYKRNRHFQCCIETKLLMI